MQLRGILSALCLLACFCGFAFAATLAQHETHTFDRYIETFGRRYERGSPEYDMRRPLFERRLAGVQNHNDQLGQRWFATAGAFADRTDMERAAVRGWRRMQGSTRGGVQRSGFGGGASLLEVEVSPLPPKADWRFLNTASNIIDQSDCGSCWAATTAATLEAHYEIHHGATRTFSVQEIVSCTPNPRQCGGKGGCDGATVELGMDLVLKNGLGTEESLPYQASNDVPCPNRPSLQVESDIHRGRSLGLVGWQTLPKNQGDPLARAVAELGPVAISVSADAWHEYGGGIFDGCINDVVVDHAVTLYGYGEDAGTKYWLIRNTWGPDWGENGFIRMLRHKDGETYCGVDRDNQEGTGCKGDPTEVEVCGMCGMFSDSVVPHFAGAKNLTHVRAPHWLTGDRPGPAAQLQSLGQASGVVSAATALADAVGAAITQPLQRRTSEHSEQAGQRRNAVSAAIGADARILRRADPAAK